MVLLVDTSVLIDVLRRRHGRRELLASLARAGHTLATTSLNVAELYAGMRAEEQVQTAALLDGLECYDVTREAGALAGTMKHDWSKKGRTIGLADTIIAAIALKQHCVLMTDNRKDFPMAGLEYYPLPVV